MQNTVLVFDVSEQALANAVSLGAEGASSAAEVAMKADIIVLAVKPQFYPDVLPQVQGNLRKTAMVISLAPGYDIAALKKVLGQEQRIVRAMPNTPALLGEGMTSVAFSEDSYEVEEKEAVLQIFRKAGKAVEIREALMDAAMAAASCSPALCVSVHRGAGRCGDRRWECRGHSPARMARTIPVGSS
ncbi:MAG: pyrroline-5-carboxylate reductase family protein [Clostridia bacterium]